MEQQNQKKEQILYLNPKLYPLDVVYSAAYLFLDKAFISLDGDPERNIQVRIAPREEINLNDVVGAFKNELINYGEYKINFQRNKDIRNLIVQKALVTNDPTLETKSLSQDVPKDPEDMSEEELGITKPWEEEGEEDYVEDPLGIAKTWEESFGEEDAEEDEELFKDTPEKTDSDNQNG
ncbi:MAG: hypothetical protein ACOCQX_04085 [Candidatus Nanoarchaeia archaeon]